MHLVLLVLLMQLVLVLLMQLVLVLLDAFGTVGAFDAFGAVQLGRWVRGF